MKSMAPGIRASPVIRDHPNWWTFLNFDGFRFNVYINASLHKCSENKIRIVKEEASTSRVNQNYDQAQVQTDKGTPRQLLKMEQSKVKFNIDQWNLISILTIII